MTQSNRIGSVLAAALAAISLTPAAALAETSNMAVSAEVQASCTISAGALAFGTYNTVSGSAVDGTATVDVACTQDTVATITLGQGANADVGSTDAAPLRRMLAGTDYLDYVLFSDSGRTTAWANTAGTGKGYTATSSASNALTVYGRVSASQDVPAGSYTDTVVATISY